MSTKQCSSRSRSVLAGLLLCTAASAIVSGCAPQPRRAAGPPLPAADPVSRTDYPNVVVAPSLEGFLLIAEPSVSTEPHSGIMKVNVPLRTEYNGDLALEYRVRFLDASGAEQNPDTPWKMIKLSGRAQRIVEARSIQSDTSDWRMEIRPLR